MPQDTYAVGDLQGCHESFNGLMEQIPDDARIVFLGDLVNRGPDSLETLRAVKNMCESGHARTVLGNHDMHLLAVAAGGSCPHRRDTITGILKAEDRTELIDWLRRQPLLIDDEEAVFVHAGIPPAWSLLQAKLLAREVESQLSSPRWAYFLRQMYGADNFSAGIAGDSRMRAILNSFTRMRFIRPDGLLDFDIKEGISCLPEGYRPWFECPRKITKTICFGHWSMLGLMLRGNVICVDTGCLWGGALSAVRLSDRRLFQEPCPMWSAPSC